MSIAKYIKEIGRGKNGARALTEEQAHDLFCQVLDKQVTDLEIGAFCIAMRIKGESTSELAGFLRAAQARCLKLVAPASSSHRPVLLPSYNGARKLPNLTPLLAELLARQGVPVLVHGPERDPQRVNSAEIFAQLGWPLAQNAVDVQSAWDQRLPIYIPIEVLSPALAKLLAVRQIVGLRNPGHTIAKILDPTLVQNGLRVVNYTHPDYAQAHDEFLRHSHANAVLMQGHEGEPVVVNPKRLSKLSVYIHGELRPDLTACESLEEDVSALPQAIDAQSTATYIQQVLNEERAAPSALTQQVARLVQAAKS
jgi:anthranilate phosphoribosyltransferase